MAIAYLPLDERPCNTDFPDLLSRIGKSGLRIAHNKSELRRYLNNFESAIVSIDRWVYGGLVESRKPGLTIQQAQTRMRELQKLLSNARKEVFAFSVLMRQAPNAMSATDEKTAELVNLASRLHRNKTNFRAILKLIPKRVWQEYLDTRKRNLAVNKRTIQSARTGMLKYAVIGMDDFAREGMNCEEARKLKALLQSERVKKKTLLLPGADELGMLLFARKFLQDKKLSPRIFPLYSHSNPDQFQLRYDGIPLTSILKSQLHLLGATLSRDPRETDLFLFIHTPQEDQLDIPCDSPVPRFSYRWLKSLQSFLIRERRCILADLRFANGADSSLMRAISWLAPIQDLFGFSAWNTTANALGMALSQGVVRWGAERVGEFDPKAHENLLCLRMLEDWLYQAEIRTALLKRLRKEGRPTQRLERHHAKELSGEVTEKLSQLSRTHLLRHFPGLKVTEVNFPWNRLFDVEIKFHSRWLGEIGE